MTARWVFIVSLLVGCAPPKEQHPSGTMDPAAVTEDAGTHPVTEDAGTYPDASTPSPAAAVPEVTASHPSKHQDPCAPLFAREEDTPSPTPVREAARRFFVKNVFLKRIDLRSPSEHPMFVTTVGSGTGEELARCVDDWASTCPDCVVQVGSKVFIDRSRYDIVRLEFNDAADGEYNYVFVIDTAKLRVSAAFRESNFVP